MEDMDELESMNGAIVIEWTVRSRVYWHDLQNNILYISMLPADHGEDVLKWWKIYKVNFS